MHLPIIILLGSQFLLCQRVSALQNSVLKNQILSIDEAAGSALGKFFTKLSDIYLKKRPPWQITIIGGSDDQLQQAQPIYENYPFTMCTDPKKCSQSKIFISASFFIVFLNDLGQKTLEEHVKILSDNTNEYEILFVFEGVIITDNGIAAFISRASKLSVTRYVLVHLVEDGVKVYRPFLEDDCSVGARLVPDLETYLRKTRWLSRTLNNAKRCPIPVGSFQYMPQMAIEEKKNGSLAIVGGRDGMLVLLLAEKLNFTVDLKYPSRYDKKGYSKKSALIKDVASGTIHFAISRVRPTNQLKMSVPFDEECITWAVPRIAPNRSILWIEFPLEVWILIITVFITSCAIGYIEDVILSRNANQRGVTIGRIILSVVSLNLGNAATYQPVSVSGKMLMIACLYYALVTTTAYKASMDSIWTTFKTSSTITDIDGILEQNLEVGGSGYHYRILKDQGNENEMISELIKRYIIYSNDSIAATRVATEDNFAFLSRESTLKYNKQMIVKNKKLLKFNILDKCASHYPVVLVFWRGSFLLQSVNNVISRIQVAGILDHWDRVDYYMKDKELEKENSDTFSGLYKAQKFKRIFLFYAGCIFICLLVFIIEIVVARCKPKKRILRQRYKKRGRKDMRGKNADRISRALTK